MVSRAPLLSSDGAVVVVHVGSAMIRQLLSSLFFLIANLLVFIGSILAITTDDRHSGQHRIWEVLGFGLLFPHVGLELSLDFQNDPRAAFHGRYAGGGVRLANLLVSLLLLDATVASFMGALVNSNGDGAATSAEAKAAERIGALLWCLVGTVTCCLTMSAGHGRLDRVGNMLFFFGTVFLWVVSMMPQEEIRIGTDDEEERVLSAATVSLVGVYLVWLVSGVLYVTADLKRWRQERAQQQSSYSPIASAETEEQQLQEEQPPNP